MLPFAPPTDNLYKFLSIAGLLTFLSSAYFTFSSYHQLNDEKASYDNDKTKVDLIRSRTKNIQTIIRTKIRGYYELNNNTDKSFVVNDTLVAYTRTWGGKYDHLAEKINEMQQEYSTLVDEIDVRNADLLTKLQVYNNHVEHYNWMAIATALFFATGLFVTFKGFALWYNKVQKFQDEVLRGQYLDYIEKNNVKQKVEPNEQVEASKLETK